VKFSFDEMNIMRHAQSRRYDVILYAVNTHTTHCVDSSIFKWINRSEMPRHVADVVWKWRSNFCATLLIF